MAYKMFSVGLVMLAFVGMSLCQQQQQFNSGLPSQYLSSTMSQGSFQGSPAVVQQARTTFDDIESQSDKLSFSNLEQSKSYQDAVQQQNLAQSYQTAFGNTGVQYSTGTPNSYRGNQDSQQYYAPATQQSAEPQFITKESYSTSLPVVIPVATPAQVQPDYKQQFTTPTQNQQDIFGTDAAQVQHEYRHHQDYRNQHLPSLAQAQVEYKQQDAALEQAQLEYKKQFAAISQTQQELKQQFAAPVEAQHELKKQFSALVQAQKEYKQQFAALNEAQLELKQQFAVPVQVQQELIQQSTVLMQAQHEFTKQFSALAQAQQEYKQQFAELVEAQLEFKQQFAALIQAQKELKQQFVDPNQIHHGYKHQFNAPAQQVYRQYAVPHQGGQDYRQRFVVPTPAYLYIQKSTASTATGPINYPYVAQYPAAQTKSQTVSVVQPKLQDATIPQQYYHTVPTGQITVTEQPRVQQSATNQSSSGVVISTTPTPSKESVTYKSESTPTPLQQPKVHIATSESSLRSHT
ncbi:uncharacterized protein LOC132945302 [Metopolophium dirhodum]|uniref:uncharacterized protein LOC132945302 n=1 Tax=Metopolophium dirhodum TaxID=44670 RepID=UPI00298F9CA9|nr:uncharacterized protein LOC132945302 [Metopolophium dirhodum]